jgi:hypothetical protein
MLNITNNSANNNGCLDISVSRGGTDTEPYNGSSNPNLVTDKTFTIAPTSTPGSGNVDITFYFTEAEIAGWEGVTGLLRGDLIAARGSATSVTETTGLTIGSFGTDVTLTGNFSGLDGIYYFGPLGAFGCSGVTKTWDGTNWTPTGAPISSDNVIINGTYDTATDGDLNACTLVVNTGEMLTVDGNGFVQVQGDVTVDGTLIVAHTGNFVQIDNDATVTNNGTINVNLTTPDLASRDYMILGSPMSAETRGSVWVDPFLVLNHTTANFCPNADVAAAFPLAYNFADDNYDSWSVYNAGITPGEGYLVRPQAGFGQPGGIYNYTYDDGTLNNGEVLFTVGFNTTCPGGDDKNASPNVVANPYASAISASAFIMANAMVDEVFFWEHLTPPSPSIPGAGSMNFSMQDISMYNLSGGTAAASDIDPLEPTEPNGVIATGQGFAFKANAGGTAVFNNSMRLTSGNNTLRAPETIERLRLSITSDEYQLQNTTLIAFTENGTPQIDAGYDSRRLANVLGLFSHLPDGSDELGIQTREAFNSSIEIPMGFQSQVAAESQYKIVLRDREGANVEGATVYLVDNATGIIHDFANGSYVFTSEEGAYANRFTLKFENQEELGTTENALENISVFPNPTQDIVNVSSPNNPITGIEVYDLRGRKVISEKFNGLARVAINLAALESAIYFVNIQTERGEINERVIKK